MVPGSNVLLKACQLFSKSSIILTVTKPHENTMRDIFKRVKHTGQDADLFFVIIHKRLAKHLPAQE